MTTHHLRLKPPASRTAAEVADRYAHLVTTVSELVDVVQHVARREGGPHNLDDEARDAATFRLGFAAKSTRTIHGYSRLLVAANSDDLADALAVIHHRFRTRLSQRLQLSHDLFDQRDERNARFGKRRAATPPPPSASPTKLQTTIPRGIATRYENELAHAFHTVTGLLYTADQLGGPWAETRFTANVRGAQRQLDVLDAYATLLTADRRQVRRRATSLHQSLAERLDHDVRAACKTYAVSAAQVDSWMTARTYPVTPPTPAPNLPITTRPVTPPPQPQENR